MTYPTWTRVLAAGAAATLSGAAAATAPADDAAALPSAPRLTYASAFASMIVHADAAPVEWSRSNALVGALQGHAGHLRAATPPAPGASAPPRSRRGAHDHDAAGTTP